MDGSKCVDFLLHIPSCTFNENAWICSYERLDSSNYYPLCDLALRQRQQLHSFIGN